MGTGLPPPHERSLPLPVDSTPSLATLLATPLAGVSTSSKTPPLVLSSALPAIPGKVVETIRAGGYIDFKELLPDNMALRRRLMEAGWGTTHSQASNSREIKDVTTWVHCFLSFVAAKVDSEETRQLMAYGQIVLMLATKYGGLGWRLYDAHFRQLVSAGQHLPWAEINPSMMLADVVRSGGTSCPLCQGHDHEEKDCALAVTRSTQPQKVERRPVPYNRTEDDGICRRFNRSGGCPSSRCRFEHKCSRCGKVDHGAAGCRQLKAASKPKGDTPTPPPRPT